MKVSSYEEISMVKRLMRIVKEKYWRKIVGDHEEFHLENCPKLQRTSV